MGHIILTHTSCATACPLSFFSTYNRKHKKSTAILAKMRWTFGADDGNRTRVASLGSWNSAIELHPHTNYSCIVPHKKSFCNSFSVHKGKEIAQIFLQISKWINSMAHRKQKNVQSQCESRKYILQLTYYRVTLT